MIFHYLKFFLFHLVGLLALAVLVAGGVYVTVGLLAIIAFYVLGDALGGDDVSAPRFGHPGLLTAQLWVALPLLTLIVFASVWSVCAGDALGFGAAVARLTGYDALAARAATSIGGHVSGVFLTGLMIGMIGTIPAHELTHRTRDPWSMVIGRWLLAFSLDTVFAIEHVYGHHRYVATDVDPATAPRGRNVYHHIVLSTLRSNASGWHIEAARLARLGQPLLGMHNRVIRGQLMTLALLAAVYALGGPRALLYFLACALWAKALLEVVNYMEHYGLVRETGAPVQPRHSWNTNRRLSSWSLFNLTRHSHHHAQGGVPYHDLRPMADAPVMISGYLTTILVAMLPPLWRQLMRPRIEHWDRHFATAGERLLTANAPL